MTDLSVLTWPLAELGSAIEALARKSGLSPKPVHIPRAPEATAHDNESLGRWIEATAVWMGLEAEPLAISYEAVDQLMRRAGPTLFRIPADAFPRFLVVLGSSRSTVSILGPDLGVARVRPEVIHAALCRSIEEPLLAEIDRLLADTGISQSRNRMRTALMREKLRDRQLNGCWLLHLPPSSSFWRQMLQARLPQALILLASVQTAEYAMWILAWWLVGRASLEGRFDYGWLLGWALLLITLVPLLLLSTWLQGVVAIGGGVLFKRRLLYGALRLHPEEIRHQGSGQFLGRVIESEAVESLALSGGFLGLIAVIELALSAAVLGAGAAGIFHVFLLLAWTVLTFALSVSYFHRRQHWTEERLQMTHDLVERMVGHRTWLVQEPRERWHEGEDQTLERYQEASAKMDHAAALLMAFAPRGWLLIGLVGTWVRPFRVHFPLLVYQPLLEEDTRLIPIPRPAQARRANVAEVMRLAE